MRRKDAERSQARLLRAEGASIKAIAAELGVSVSSVSNWTRDITLTDEQREALLLQAGRVRGERWRSRYRERRLAYQDEGRQRARLLDPLHMAGCMLYWGEGSKAKNMVQLANSDAGLLRFFVDFLRTSYDVSDDRFVMSVNCFLGNGLEIDEIEGWWLAQLALPATALRGAVVNRPSRASKFTGRILLHGTAQVRVHSTEIVQSIYGAIQEYAGIDRPEWLG